MTTIAAVASRTQDCSYERLGKPSSCTGDCNRYGTSLEVNPRYLTHRNVSSLSGSAISSNISKSIEHNAAVENGCGDNSCPCHYPDDRKIEVVESVRLSS